MARRRCRLRELSGGRRSLDDFNARFSRQHRRNVSTYELADVVKALNAVAPFDWNLCCVRVERQGPARDGRPGRRVRLVFNDKPNAVISDYEKSGVGPHVFPGRDDLARCVAHRSGVGVLRSRQG